MKMRPIRLIGACIVALAIAFAAALQAGSNVLLRENPAIAVQLMPQNGLARERLASANFIGGLTSESDIVPSAKTARPDALRAFSSEPLAPKSLAIIAIAEDDAERKAQILETASKLNRRDLLLQGLVLESRISREDYAGTLVALDNILNVHPEQKNQFFPVLASALQDERAAAELGAVLDTSSYWHEQFLEFAAADRAALPNLVRLRMARDSVDPKIDQRLIAGLVANGDIANAYRIYEKATEAMADAGSSDRISWTSDYPPFDWKFTSEAGFRAQSAISGTAIEVFVRSGQGGVLAERLIAVPVTGTQIHLTHTLSPAAQVKDVRLQLSCPGDTEPALDEQLRIRPMQIDLPDLSSRCRFARLVIQARSWSGRSSIRGAINQLKVVAN